MIEKYKKNVDERKEVFDKKKKTFDNDFIEPQTLHEFQVSSVSFEFKRKKLFFFWREACTSMFTNVDDRKFSNLCEWGQSRNGINYLFAEIFHLCFYLHSRHTREINQQVVVHSIKRKTFFFFSFFNYFLRETIKRDNLDVLMQSKHAFFIRSSKNRVSERIMSTWFMLEKDMS